MQFLRIIREDGTWFSEDSEKGEELKYFVKEFFQRKTY